MQLEMEQKSAKCQNTSVLSQLYSLNNASLTSRLAKTRRICLLVCIDKHQPENSSILRLISALTDSLLC